MGFDLEKQCRSQKCSQPSVLRIIGCTAFITFLMLVAQQWIDAYTSFGFLTMYEKYGEPAMVTVQAVFMNRNDFPHLIWQADKELFNSPFGAQKDSWKRLNPEYQYDLITDDLADQWVDDHFSESSPSLVAFWHDLHVPAARTNLLRYLVMLSEGGVFAAVETTCARPISQWLPNRFRHGPPVRAIIGLATNDTGNDVSNLSKPTGFVHWSFIAQPGHPIFEGAMLRVMANMEFIARRRQSKLLLKDWTDVEMDEITGPGAFTDAVLEVLRDQTGDVDLDIGRFHGMMMPTLVGDVLILPVDAFGTTRHRAKSMDARISAADIAMQLENESTVHDAPVGHHKTRLEVKPIAAVFQSLLKYARAWSADDLPLGAE